MKYEEQEYEEDEEESDDDYEPSTARKVIKKILG